MMRKKKDGRKRVIKLRKLVLCGSVQNICFRRTAQ